MTDVGIILGTAAYMAPEQARGRAVDRRADVWAFGCVLYEMLTGRRAFQGDDVTDIITSVMRDTPDWQALPAGTPASIRLLLRRCLDKDVRKRAPHMSIARLAIEDASPGGDIAAVVASSARGATWRLAVIIGVAAAAAAAALTLSLTQRNALPQRANGVFRYSITGPARSNNAAGIAVSPDGRYVAVVARDNQEPPNLGAGARRPGIRHARRRDAWGFSVLVIGQPRDRVLQEPPHHAHRRAGRCRQ